MIESLKKVMDGLSAQYVNDNLSTVNKIEVLNHRKPRIIKRPAKLSVDLNLEKDLQQSQPTLCTKRHIALLCDDTTNHNVLSYVLGNSSDCNVDILYHGAHKNTQADSFYKQARLSFLENNVDIRLVKLINDSIAEVKDYLVQQRSLQYLVSDSHDALIKDFLNNKLFKNQINVPIVLIN
ncbi:hypothetical protein [sulfur-oxidizing endosymbiont of Gigantopelta aegis]|uniref:hypothetical protein n=1 Tax=sulfur-oxidizing endosymbiont of Gigantopelta aegis TaxID=2794934 RepID=UPI0018DDDE0F|nr:hypothetical protein [sulfur-oxidizing endosymbiont of Gigantopelta aegis]